MLTCALPCPSGRAWFEGNEVAPHSRCWMRGDTPRWAQARGLSCDTRLPSVTQGVTNVCQPQYSRRLLADLSSVTMRGEGVWGSWTGHQPGSCPPWSPGRPLPWWPGWRPGPRGRAPG